MFISFSYHNEMIDYFHITMKNKKDIYIYIIKASSGDLPSLFMP